MEYRDALQVAQDAARAAGRLLLAEWHRPDGPRGGGSKAEADTLAELDIRQRLTSRFPTWRFKGEETGIAEGAAGEPHCWLVDPNDGTIPYLAGFRGSAVAIGLLRDGLPVLGVVFAFCYPDDRGDLLAWAEGCGPIERNGQPVPPPVWPDALSAGDVVLVSQAADRKPEANLSLVAPARYRCVPSIAYRLALVAAGEGVATFSVNSPGDYDYGAAHALLRGVQGDLVDEQGRTVTYTPQGVSKTARCFGGAPKVVRELARRPWTQMADAVPRTGTDFGLVRLQPGHNVGSIEQLDRAQGSLLGLLAGDALGSLVEFDHPETIRRMYPKGLRAMADGGTFNTLAGQPTDDGELALSLARSLVRTGQYDGEDVARSYAAWYQSQPFDIGLTTRRAFGRAADALSSGRVLQAARDAADGDSQANGALMRVGPLAIWGVGRTPDVLAREAVLDASLSHPHVVCKDANRAFTRAIAVAIEQPDPQQVWKAALASSFTAAIQEALNRARSTPPADYLQHQGWVVIAMQNAFYQLLHASSLQEGLVDTVMRGGDTDTNGAVAGALLGALHGRSNVPFQWRQMVLSCRPLSGLPAVHRPRPQFLWPVDALDLAERLLVCGHLQEA